MDYLWPEEHRIPGGDISLVNFLKDSLPWLSGFTDGPVIGGHLGHTRHLKIERPGLAMIMRRSLFWGVCAVPKNLHARAFVSPQPDLLRHIQLCQRFLNPGLVDEIIYQRGTTGPYILL